MAKSPAWSTLFDRANFALAAMSGVFLILVLALVFVGVITRYVLNTPIVGINEFVELASLAVVMLALPYCTANNGHVTVDVLDHAIGAWGRFIGDLLSRLLSSWILGVLVLRAWHRALDAYEFGDATNMLGLPLWPFYAFVAAGMTLCVTVLILQVVMILLKKVRE